MPREFFWSGEAGSGLTQSLSIEDGKLLSHTYDPNYVNAMEYLKKVRSSADVQDMSFGRWKLSIPELALLKLERKYPELASDDHQIQTAAWKKFINSSEARPYMVKD